MNPFGDGSDGALNVPVSDSTMQPGAYLQLNRKYQFTDVNIPTGAILSVNSTVGSVLYILAKNSFTLNGTIQTAGVINYGNNTWGVTIDGVSYVSPGVGQGGNGLSVIGQGGAAAFGYGGGGGGGRAVAATTGGNATASGGNGGDASQTFGNPGTSSNVSALSNQRLSSNGTNGTGSAGGGGGSAVSTYADGGVSVYANAKGGNGGSSYGFAGGNGTGNGGYNGGNGGYSFNYVAGGGGGSGGHAGRAGIHVVIKSPKIILNGEIITIGSDGQGGGNGGAGISNGNTAVWYGYGGGGGGAGNGGNIKLYYGTQLTDTSMHTMNGGVGGLGGMNGNLNPQARAVSGADGNPGSYDAYQIPPFADFTASTVSGQRPLSVSFTNLSSGADTYLWNFGDGTTSTAVNPVHVYNSAGSFNVSLTATNAAGNNVNTKSAYVTTTIAVFTPSAVGTINVSGMANRTYAAKRNASGTIRNSGGAGAVVLRDPQALEEKKYLYKVYDPEGNYIELWADVIDDPQFTQEINELGSAMTVILGRNSDSVGTSTGPLLTEAGTVLTTESGDSLLVSTQSRNQVGPGSSVQHNNRVDIMVYYGGVEDVLTESNEPIMTENGENILATIGAPNGRRLYSGFISEINPRYGNNETTVVQISSYGFDLDQYVLSNSSNETTVTFNSTDPSIIAQSVMDRFATVSSADETTYTRRTTTSISLSGTSVSYTFKVNTFGDALKKILELLPSNWYFYVGLGDNTVYFRQRPSTPLHLFYLGKHISALDLKSSILDVTNDVYFTGGGEPALYKRYTAAKTLNTRRGLQLYSDIRVTVEDSADTISEGLLDEGNKIQYRSTVEILAKTYDIESIEVGDVVGFRNFGIYVDDLTMQVVGKSYSPDSVQLQLETKPPTVNKRLEDLRRNQIISDNQDNPASPTA